MHGARARLGRRGASAGSLVRLDDGQACTAEGRRAHSPRHHQRKPPPRAGCSLSKHGLWGALSHPSGPEQQQQQPTGGAAEAGRSGETSSVSDEQQKYGGDKLPARGGTRVSGLGIRKRGLQMRARRIAIR